MSEGAKRFFNGIENAAHLKESDLIDLFVYYLTIEAASGAANAVSVDECFKACDLTPPVSTAPYLSKGLKSRPQKFVKVDGGYKLQHHYRESISKRLGAATVVVQTSVELRRLELKVVSGVKKEFLKETIDCFEAGACRAAIIMCWILVMDHLFDSVFFKPPRPLQRRTGKSDR